MYEGEKIMRNHEEEELDRYVLLDMLLLVVVVHSLVFVNRSIY